MILIGTLYNTIAVAAGAAVGLASHKRISHDIQHKILIVFGLFTLALSVQMFSEMHAPIDIFLALVLGALLGQTISIEDKFSAFISKYNSKNLNKSDKPDISSGFIKATTLFCVGGLTLIGCMEEGIKGDYHLLLIKGSMDLISSFFLAAALGRGVLFSAIGVLIFQGSLTLLFMFVGTGMSPELVLDLTATGGILLLALGFDLMKIKSFKILDLMPAMVLIPIIHWLHIAIIELPFNSF